MTAEDFQYIECVCFHSEHTLRFQSFDGEIYVHYFLPDAKWYRRVWPALKYILGYKSKFGHFGETILSSDGKEKLRNFLLEAS